jgi:hypothetical protein
MSYVLSPDGRKYAVGTLSRKGTLRRVSLKSERDRKKSSLYIEMQARVESIKRRLKSGSMNFAVGKSHTESEGKEFRECDQSPLGGDYYDNGMGDDVDNDNDNESEITEDEDEDDSTSESDDEVPPSLEYMCGTGRGKKLKKCLATDSTEPSKRIIDSEALFENWEKFIRLSTSDSSIRLPTKRFPDVSSTPLYRCNCQPSRRRFTAIFLHSILSSSKLRLTLPECAEVDLYVCKESCDQRLGWLGLVTHGFFPSTPVKPRYIWHVDIFHFFHGMYMKGPTSTPAFCSTLHNLLMHNGAKGLVKD